MKDCEMIARWKWTSSPYV